MNGEHLLSHWAAVRAGLFETIDKFRDDELDFRPSAASWTVQQLMLHIAQEEHGEFAYGLAQTLSEFPTEYPVHDYPTRAAIKQLLESVHAQTLDYLTAMRDDDLSRVVETPWGARYPAIEMIDHMIDHEIHHRAELSLILGLLGREGLNA
jgi:uncharacterized damage-inducible protein DinB